MFYLSQTGFSLPERTYYLEESPEMIKHRETLVAVITRFYKMLGYSDAESFSRAKAILEFETKIAHITDDKEKSRKDHGTQTSWAEVEAKMPYWPWKSWLTQV